MTHRRELLDNIFRAALHSVRPDVLIPRVMRLDGDTLHIYGQAIDLRERRVLVLAAGKAAATMAQSVEAMLGECIADGLAVTKHGFGAPLGRIRLIEAGHPTPNRASVEAGQRMLDLAANADEHTLALVLLSGGGSSLLCAPWRDEHTQLTLEDLIAVNRLMLASGASIQEMNTLRRRLSRIKGGRLARALKPARTVALIMSDVIGDDLAAIASGPTAPDLTTSADAWRVVDKYRLADKLPVAVRGLLECGRRSNVDLAPDGTFDHVSHHIIASNSTALRAAAAEAVKQGLPTTVLEQPLTGEAKDAAALLYRTARAVPAQSRPRLLLAGGETTVTLGESRGEGGRNQELALAMLQEMEHFGNDGITLLSAATDGDDGPTGAAGAWADADILTAARAAGLDIADHLRRHDSHTFFQRAGGLYITGPTGVNVCDLQMILVE